MNPKLPVVSTQDTYTRQLRYGHAELTLRRNVCFVLPLRLRPVPRPMLLPGWGCLKGCLAVAPRKPLRGSFPRATLVDRRAFFPHIRISPLSALHYITLHNPMSYLTLGLLDLHFPS